MYCGRLIPKLIVSPLRERYTSLSPLRYWVADLPNAYPTKWVNKAYAGDESLDREEMDAYELGWRLRPSKDLLFELSVYQYDTQNAVRAADERQFGQCLSSQRR